jgi:hypothetical protein
MFWFFGLVFHMGAPQTEKIGKKLKGARAL